MKHRIVVLGAGYAGASTVGSLVNRLHADDVDITLVNAEPDFVERVRLHQLAAGQDLRERPLGRLVSGTGAAVRVARVTAIDVTSRTVAITGADGPDELDYDTLVYALGSSVDPQNVPGVTDHAYEVASRPGAHRLHARLGGLGPGARVVVVGGGLTGIEAASEIAESFGHLQVTIAVRGQFGEWLSPAGQRHLRGTFARLGVTVHEQTEVVGVGVTEVETDGGRTLPADVTVWTGGFATHPLAAESGLEVSERGRILVDPTMRSTSHPDVYAVGDAAFAHGPLGNPLRMSCASGIPMAWQAAGSIVARLTGGRLPHTPLRYVQQCISLGRRDAIIQLVTADDRAKAPAPGGRLAATYKELICRGAAFVATHPRPAIVRRRVVTGTTRTRPAARVA